MTCTVFSNIAFHHAYNKKEYGCWWSLKGWAAAGCRNQTYKKINGRPLYWILSSPFLLVQNNGFTVPLGILRLFWRIIYCIWDLFEMCWFFSGIWFGTLLKEPTTVIELLTILFNASTDMMQYQNIIIAIIKCFNIKALPNNIKTGW